MTNVINVRARKQSTPPVSTNTRVHETTVTGDAYVSPRELAIRWRCSRSTVDRIAERERLTRVCLGDGPNGMIRYILAEVEGYEKSRMLGR